MIVRSDDLRKLVGVSASDLTAWYNENAGGRVIDDHPDPVDVLSRHPVASGRS